VMCCGEWVTHADIMYTPFHQSTHIVDRRKSCNFGIDASNSLQMPCHISRSHLDQSRRQTLRDCDVVDILLSKTTTVAKSTTFDEVQNSKSEHKKTHGDVAWNDFIRLTLLNSSNSINF